MGISDYEVLGSIAGIWTFDITVFDISPVLSWLLIREKCFCQIFGKEISILFSPIFLITGECSHFASGTKTTWPTPLRDAQGLLFVSPVPYAKRQVEMPPGVAFAARRLISGTLGWEASGWRGLHESSIRSQTTTSCQCLLPRTLALHGNKETVLSFLLVVNATHSCPEGDSV